MPDGSKILSYAVFQLTSGDDRAIGLYHNAMPAVLRACLTLMPSWTVVLHHDESVLDHPYGKVLIAAESRNLLRLRPLPKPRELCKGMLWRLRPIWHEPGAEIVACRDMDSLPMARGRVALEAFVASDAWVHCLLDNVQHGGLMGGMSAYRASAIRRIYPCSWDEFQGLGRIEDWNKHGADQDFIARVIWEKTAEHSLTHQLDGRATADLPINDISDVPTDVMIEADKLTPYMGAAGFDHLRAVEFFDRQPATEVLRSIESECGWSP